MPRTSPQLTLDFDGLRPPSPFMTEAHHAWRAEVRSFVERKIAPHLDEWDAAGTFPDEIYTAAAAAGILGMGFPEELGGRSENADPYYRMIFAEEFHRLGTGVVFADLATHWIGLPPVIRFGSRELVEKVARPVLAGQKKIAFAVTEPSGGSDVSNLQTRAERRGDMWMVNGAKTLISGAMRADYLLTAVRTGEAGASGISLLLIAADSPGVARRPVAGLRWYNANNGAIELSDVEVPAGNLIGPENAGFKGLANQFNIERLSGIAATLAMARLCLAEALAWARQRHAFGKRLVEHQAMRHKLVDMLRLVRAAYGYLDQCMWQIQRGDMPVADICMLKIEATTVLERCARDAMHVLGGSAYSGRSRVERVYREARLFSLGGGTEEVLRDQAARQLGL